MGIFECETPNGYPDDASRWANSNVVLQRWTLARRLRWSLYQVIPTPLRQPPALREATDRTWEQTVIDLIAARFTGELLSEASNEAGLQILETANGDVQERLLTLVTLKAVSRGGQR